MFGQKSSKRAAQQAQNVANQGASNLEAVNTANTAMYQPSLGLTNSAITPLQQLLGLNGADAQAGYNAVTNDAGYQYGLKSAMDAQAGSAAGRGLLLSGKSLLDNADIGNRYYGDAREQAINNYIGLFNTGLNTIGNIAGNNLNTAQNAANLRTGGANVYAQQRAQNAQNNFGLFSNLLNYGMGNLSKPIGSPQGGS